jgi:polyhydroxybutyrate depolymerase
VRYSCGLLSPNVSRVVLVVALVAVFGALWLDGVAAAGEAMEFVAFQEDGSTEPEPPGEPFFGQERVSGKYLPIDVADSERKLVILLHGYGQSIFGIIDQVPLLPAAVENGWILVVPSGLSDALSRPYWSATSTCCDINIRRNDDVGYLRSVIEREMAIHPIDRDNVTVVGLSNGAFLAYRMACDAADIVGTVVTISGVEKIDAEECQPKRPVNVYHIHGLYDRAVFFSGGLVGVKPETFAPYPSATITVNRWADRNACPTDKAERLSVPRGEGGQWRNCSDGTAVQYRWLPDPHAVTMSDELVTSIVDFIEQSYRAPLRMR